MPRGSSPVCPCCAHPLWACWLPGPIQVQPQGLLVPDSRSVSRSIGRGGGGFYPEAQTHREWIKHPELLIPPLSTCLAPANLEGEEMGRSLSQRGEGSAFSCSTWDFRAGQVALRPTAPQGSKSFLIRPEGSEPCAQAVSPRHVLLF